jgi:hypothetical protein
MDPEEVIKSIESSFDRPERSATSLRQYFLTDQHGMSREITQKEWVKAGKARVDSEWEEIPDSEIEECNCLLAHMQANEFRYFLPAYMRYSVKNFRKSICETDIIGSVVSSLFPSSKQPDLYTYNTSQFSLLNNAQKLTIIQFLTFVSTMADHVQRPDATKALERYWNKCVVI